MTKVAKSFALGRDPRSLVVVIPREFQHKLGAEPGDHFSVAINEKGEIIYKPLDLEGK